MTKMQLACIMLSGLMNVSVSTRSYEGLSLI